jgi:hypothetical protein
VLGVQRTERVTVFVKEEEEEVEVEVVVSQYRKYLPSLCVEKNLESQLFCLNPKGLSPEMIWWALILALFCSKRIKIKNKRTICKILNSAADLIQTCRPIRYAIHLIGLSL